jgi:predicted metal-dependent phosphotriesterase family hydrolase
MLLMQMIAAKAYNETGLPVAAHTPLFLLSFRAIMHE